MPCNSMIEYIPHRLRPNTTYRLWVGEGEAPTERFTTGDFIDREPPQVTGGLDLHLVPGNFTTSCDYGDPTGIIKIKGVHDSLTPDETLLFRVKAEPITSSDYFPFESILASNHWGDEHTIWLAVGSDHCHKCNFTLPPPLLPARLTVTAIDLAGNESQSRQVDFIGPHTAATSELAYRLANMSPLDRAVLKSFHSSPVASAPPAHTPNSTGKLNWPMAIGSFALGLLLGAGTVLKSRRNTAGRQ
jgi:hypothetical protein